jgi:5'-nucleotidase
LHILLTNDDGVHFAGLHALWRAVRELGKVSVVAPMTEQSGVAHSITLTEPLHVRKVRVGGEFSAFGVTGAPADCVRLAVKELLDEPPDVVMSGINWGINAGMSVFYSGTVAAAIEGGLLGIPSMAVSLQRVAKPSAHWRIAAEVAVRAMAILKAAQKGAKGEPVVLNVNVPGLPREQLKGFRLTQQGARGAEESFIRRKHPRGGYYFWTSGDLKYHTPHEEDDLHALNEGYVSVTPLHCDMTCRSLYGRLRRRKWTLF